jgi:hypothetical protein
VTVPQQTFTLIGVALGALFSYLITSLNERSRYRRDIATRLLEWKYDAYYQYLKDVREMVIIANRIAASLGLHHRTTLLLSQEEGLPMLAEVGTRRSASSERVRMLAEEDTAKALRDLNNVAWDLELIARGTIANVKPETWEATMQTYLGALNAYHRNIRRELGIPGQAIARTADSARAKQFHGPLQPPEPKESDETAP